MKLFTKNALRNLALSALSAAVLSACGGAGSCTRCASPTPAPGELTLSIAAPTQYPAGLPTPIEALLTMTNTSNVNASNLVYTIPAPNQAGNYTGVVITPNAGIGSQSGACTNIAAGASCTFTATIAAYANPGSFTVTATPNGSATQQAVKTTQVGKALQADSISVTANLGLVDIPNTNNEYYILPSDQTIQGSSSSATTAYVSVLVKAAGEGLNRLKLVDETGAELSYVTLGTPHYTVNSVNSYAVTIPAGKSIQHIQALSNVCTTLNTGENNNSACSNDADVNLAQSGVGILAIQPNYFQMSESRESQIVTLQNVGTANITSLQLPQIAAPFSVLANTCSGITTLAPRASCTVTIGYTLGTDSGQGSYIVNYNNGTSAVNTSATIPYVGTGPAAYAILTASPTSFSLSESHAFQRITVTNTGTASATALVLPTLTAPLIESATSCTSGLAVSDSCTYDVYINYSQPVSAGAESVTFAYNNGQSSQTTNVAADWLAVAPQVSSELPANNATGVSLAASVSITFNESMDLTTLVAANFQLQKVSGGSFVTLTSPVYSSDGKTVTFVTSSGTANPALLSSSQYKIIIPVAANIKNATGTPLNLPSATYPNGVISTFTTDGVAQCSPEGGGWAGILNSANNSFTKCYWQTDGSLYNCSGDGTPIGLFSTPSVILPDGYGSLYAANAGSNSLAYYIGAGYWSSFTAPSPLYDLTAPARSGARVAYNISKGFVFVNTTGGLNICGINTGTGALTGCTAANPTGLSPDAYGSGFSSDGSANGIFWVTNKNSNTISSCPASASNPTVITQCNDAGGSKFNQPTAIYATNTYVLVTNSGDNTIVRCDQSSGVLSNCAYTGGNISGPSSIVAGAASDTTIYVTNMTDNSISFCKNADGVLSDCNRMVYPTGTFTAPSGIFVNNACGGG